MKIEDNPKAIRKQVHRTMLPWWRWKLEKGVSTPPHSGPRKGDLFWSTVVVDRLLYKSHQAYLNRARERYISFREFTQGMHCLLPEYFYFPRRKLIPDRVFGRTILIPVLSTCRNYFDWLCEKKHVWPERPDDEPLFNKKEINDALKYELFDRGAFDPCQTWLSPSERTKLKLTPPIEDLPGEEIDFSEAF